MTLCNSSDFLLFLLFAFIIWSLNSTLISTGVFQSFYRQYVRRYGLPDDDLDGDDEAGAIEGPPRRSSGRAGPDDGRRTTEERLAQTYAVIYGPAETYLEAEETRTWLWLSFALLVNVVCIRIEMLLFESLMEDGDDDGGKMMDSAIRSSNSSAIRGSDSYRPRHAASGYPDETSGLTGGVRG